MLHCTVHSHVTLGACRVKYDCPSDFNPKEIPNPGPQITSVFAKCDGDYVPIVPVIEMPHGFVTVYTGSGDKDFDELQIMSQPSHIVCIKIGHLEIIIRHEMTDAELARLCVERAR